MLSSARILSFVLFLFSLNPFQSKSAEIGKEISVPFSTDSNNITIWNGTTYVPFVIKGINFGVSKPGLFPGQLFVSRDEYGRWFKQIHEAGFNSIRLYTLHFPDFYDVLDSFNLTQPESPLFFFQGIWLDENILGYSNDLYFLTSTFEKEIEDGVASVYGSKIISARLGKAYGVYRTNASKWLIGYIIGREVSPLEINTTNFNHINNDKFDGNYFSIKNANPSEAWITARLDKLIKFESTIFKTEHPVSFSSWPTLDPLHHPEEANRTEDSASVDLGNINFSKAPAGYFASFHAYPYYPNFISSDSLYQSCSDELGPNSYLCYLEDLKKHYNTIPLIIAEFGCPSSWGIAHYAQNGVNHGGMDEVEQGNNSLRLFRNIFQSNCGGGLMFNWIDEWFKRTWITDLMDFDPNRRILWQNVTAAEQNFGLLGYRKENNPRQVWENYGPQFPIQSIEASADYSYFNLRLNLTNLPGILDTVWVALDTYAPTLGESILLNGKTVTDRAEFIIMITHYRADLYVTQAYDLYGNYHHVSDSSQLYHSIATDGMPWRIVRWKNDSQELTNQYIGKMRLRSMHSPHTSMDAVNIDSSFIDIHLPWMLINYSDPSSMRVIHDDKNTSATEDTLSDGISISVFTKDTSVTTSTRFTWATWNQALDAKEYLKGSYDIIKKNLFDYPGDPVSFSDQYDITRGVALYINDENGVLANDYLVDFSPAEAIIDHAPESGILFLNRSGSFTYIPDPLHVGEVSFTYRTLSGSHISKPTKVVLKINTEYMGDELWDIYPNPSFGKVNIYSVTAIDRYEIYDSNGSMVLSNKISVGNTELNLEQLSQGAYYIQLFSGTEMYTKPMLLIK